MSRHRLPRFAPKIGRQYPKRGWRQAIEPTRLPHRPRQRSFQPGPSLVGKPRNEAVVDAIENQSLVASEGIDIGDLTLEIDVVLGIDLKMDRDACVNGRQFRLDGAHLLPSDLRIGQQLKSRSALAVLVERQPMAGGLVRRQAQRLRQRLRRI